MGSQNFALFCAYEREDDLTISTSVGLIVFEFHGISFKTRPEGLVYRYRLKGYDEDWQTTTARRVEYQDLPRETFTFEVQAVDQELNYSEPASVTLNVVPDPHIQVLAEVLSQSGTKGEFVGGSQALREVQAKTRGARGGGHGESSQGGWIPGDGPPLLPQRVQTDPETWTRRLQGQNPHHRRATAPESGSETEGVDRPFGQAEKGTGLYVGSERGHHPRHHCQRNPAGRGGAGGGRITSGLTRVRP